METSAQTSEEFAIIERIARIVSSVRGTKSDYTHLAAELVQAVSFDIFGVVLLRHDKQAVRVTVCQRDPHQPQIWTSEYHQHPLHDSRLEAMLHERKLVVRDYPQGLDGPPRVSGDALSGWHQLRSTLIVPLIVGDEVLGTLELGSTHLHAYADTSLQRVVDAVARVLATAIESVQLGGNTAIQDRQRRALKEVTTALTEKMDLSAILGRIVAGITEALGGGACIVLFNRQKNAFHLKAQSALPAENVEELFETGWLVQEQCILGQTFLRRQSYISTDIARDERFCSSQPLFSALQVRSVLCQPLATGSTVYGVLCLCSTDSGGFTPLKVDILALFANQATIAIHNGMLLETAHQRNRFQQVIEQLEVAYQYSSSFQDETQSLNEELLLLQKVREETKKTFGVSLTTFLRFVSDSLLTQGEKFLYATNTSPSQLSSFLDTKDWLSEGEQLSSSLDSINNQSTDKPYSQTLSFLTQTAEAALTRAGIVGELGRLLMQLQQSANGVRDAWLMVDLRGMCTYMNPAAEELCGTHLQTFYTDQLFSSSLVPVNNTTLKLEDVFASLLPRIRNAQEVTQYLQDFAQGSLYRQELRCILASDTIALSPPPKKSRFEPVEHVPDDHYYQFIRYPLYDQDRHLVANALQVQNITEQVRDERNRSALLSSVSHDLRTPLTTIKAAVTGLLQKGVNWSEKDRQEMLEDIDREADHLTILVTALVELSRIEMGALILEREWCDILEIYYGAVNKLTRLLGGKPINTRAQNTLPLVYVDHVQLERVFYNLLENALRRSPPNSSIDVVLELSSEEHEMIRIQIIDQGECITAYEREHIFKSFYGFQSYSDSMGLAICRGIVEAHQGQIWLDASERQGACIIFTLPTHPHIVPSLEKNAFGTTRELPDHPRL